MKILDKHQEEKIIEMYQKRKPLTWIEKEVGISEKTIRKWLKENGFWNGHKPMLCYFDEFFFDKIDTEEKAYWLGFFFADGYLSSTSNLIGFELESSDISHLEKFKKALNTDKEIKIYHKNSTFGPQDNCRLIFYSSHMRSILLNYIGSVYKTFEGHLPKVEKSLESHLIRGFFDGDGCLTYEKKDYEKYIVCPNINFTGRKKDLEYIEDLSGFSWAWSKRKNNDTDNFSIGCGRPNDVLSFLHYMYDDATVFLDRKYEKYLFIIENRKRHQAKARV